MTAIAGGIEIGEQALDVLFRRVAIGGTLDGGKDGSEVGVQTLVGVRCGEDVGKELAGIDEVALGFDGIVLDFGSDDTDIHLRVMDIRITGLNVSGEVFADKAVEQGAEDILLEIPAIDRAAHIICNLLDLPLQYGALLGTCHFENCWCVEARACVVYLLDTL